MVWCDIVKCCSIYIYQMNESERGERERERGSPVTSALIITIYEIHIDLVNNITNSY